MRRLLGSPVRLALSVLILAVLYAGNPKQFVHQTDGVEPRGSPIKTVGRLLSRFEEHFKGPRGTSPQTKRPPHSCTAEVGVQYNLQLFSIYKHETYYLLSRARKRAFYIGIFGRWFPLPLIDGLPDCQGVDNCASKGNKVTSVCASLKRACRRVHRKESVSVSSQLQVRILHQQHQQIQGGDVAHKQSAAFVVGNLSNGHSHWWTIALVPRS